MYVIPIDNIPSTFPVDIKLCHLVIFVTGIAARFYIPHHNQMVPLIVLRVTGSAEGVTRAVPDGIAFLAFAIVSPNNTSAR